MARGEHPPSCARGWRQRAEVEGWSSWQITQAIHRCCGVGLLKAHRLARGWTAREAIDELRALCEREHLDPPHANIDLLNAWENGRARPRPDTIDLLARLYKANAVRLGLAADYCEETESETVVVTTAQRLPAARDRRDDEVPTLGPGLVRPPGARYTHGDERAEEAALFHETLVNAETRPTGRLLAAVERLQRETDRALAAGTVTEDQMDRLDETVLQYRREYTTTPPLPMLCQLMLELGEVRRLAARRQPGPIQRRLSHVTATLAVLSADALMKLGDIRQARAWYGTAKTAADDTGDPRLRALVRAQEAMLPYYYGDPADVVRLAREAQAIVRSVPCSPAALAAAAEGRALARMGDHEGAAQALTQAQRLFSKIKGNRASTLAFEFTEQRLYLYLSGAHAHLSNTRQAEQIQQRALTLCPPGVPSIDPALINLDRATHLARHGQEGDACELARETLMSLPRAHQTSIVFVRAQDVRDAISPAHRRTRALRGLDEALALQPAAHGRVLTRRPHD